MKTILIKLNFLRMLMTCTLLFFVVVDSFAQIIPAARRITWEGNVGIPGGVPNRTTVYATISAAAYGNGTTDATSAIQSALNACPANQVVYLSAGRYRINGNTTIPSNVTLRGAGPSATILDGRGSGDALIRFKEGIAQWNPALVAVTSGLAAGSRSITVANASGITVESYLVISQLNDTSYVTNVGVGGACTWCDNGHNGTRAMGQLVEVTSVNGTVVGIKPSLYIGYSAALSPAVYPVTSGARYAGVEDLQVYMNNSGYTANFRMGTVAYCWIRNVEGNYADGDHAQVFHSYRCEIRDSYFHDAFSHDPGQTDADIFIASKSSGILVENNILRRLHASVMINWGASGNVIAYNFSQGNFGTTVPNCMMSDLTFHGAHPMFNLWEGNVAATFTPDSYWGSSSHNTAFRNWLKGTTKINGPFTGRGPERTDSTWWAVQNNRAVALDYANRYFNLAGNVAGSDEMLNLTYYNNGTRKIPAYAQSVAPQNRSYDNSSYAFSFGYASSGDDGSSALANPLPYTTAFLHGNYNWVSKQTTWDPANPDHNLPPSLYLPAKPSWFGSVPWPAIGPDVSPTVNKIPAQIRYEGGSGSINSEEHDLPDLPGQLAFKGNSKIQYRIPQAGMVTLKAFDVTGKLVRTLFAGYQTAGIHSIAFNGKGWPAGVHLVRLEAEGRSEARKNLIME